MNFEFHFISRQCLFHVIVRYNMLYLTIYTFYIKLNVPWLNGWFKLFEGVIGIMIPSGGGGRSGIHTQTIFYKTSYIVRDFSYYICSYSTYSLRNVIKLHPRAKLSPPPPDSFHWIRKQGLFKFGVVLVKFILITIDSILHYLT